MSFHKHPKRNLARHPPTSHEVTFVEALRFVRNLTHTGMKHTAQTCQLSFAHRVPRVASHSMHSSIEELGIGDSREMEEMEVRVVYNLHRSNYKAAIKSLVFRPTHTHIYIYIYEYICIVVQWSDISILWVSQIHSPETERAQTDTLISVPK